jgi:hypothetical protein
MEEDILEEFDRKLLRLFAKKEIFSTPYYWEISAAHELMYDLMDKYDADPAWFSEMRDILDNYVQDGVNDYWYMTLNRLRTLVKRYGGDTNLIEERFQQFADSVKDDDSNPMDIDEITPEMDADKIYWENYYDFFPGVKIHDGTQPDDFIEKQKALRIPRDKAMDNIEYFALSVFQWVIKLKYGKDIKATHLSTICDENEYLSFYPEITSAIEKVKVASPEEAKEIEDRIFTIRRRGKSFARRVLHLTPELNIPDWVKEKLKSNSELNLQ